MWVDESGGTDTTGTTGSQDELTVTVDGEEYTAEVNLDIDEDGVRDTAVIEHADGTTQAFVDEDGDGDADQYIQLDADGEVVTHAAYDESTGDWVAVDPGSTGDSGESQTGSQGGMTAELPNGEVEVGPATVDTNHDGVDDTAVAQDDAGNTIGFTDVDGDGDADVAVVIDPSGQATTYEHTGDGQWTEVDSTSRAVGDAGDTSDSAWGGGTDTVEGVAKIDSVTGQWISQN
ncbi:hypothetical protein SAMN05421810_103463 [Amycolatopsis arida]|uniref:Uncharacterized protein n=1 Tax=Amycolatopsis arida TaxID=587909 RepID=A0A1I5TAQ2_9PSEU|nr:hypothetical protein [Amycolatopsis arida]TDX96158.1 hypothetical protein CLV69_103294 [Amycolatopsis arida]SFP80100.1 hypothetical protein SAMN05421810_103463 [Amycolatopsis arida]